MRDRYDILADLPWLTNLAYPGRSYQWGGICGTKDRSSADTRGMGNVVAPVTAAVTTIVRDAVVWGQTIPPNRYGVAVAESVTITDNRTGESIEIPILNGGVDARDWSKLLPGVWFYDPAFSTTAAATSAITELDGDAGILRYRGYPIEQLAEHSTYLEVAYLLIHGELPTPEQFDDVAPRDHVPHVHPRERAQALHGGLPPRRPPDGHVRVDAGRAVDLLPRGQGHRRRRDARTSRSSGSSPRCPPSPPAPTATASACRSSTRTTTSTSAPTSCR